MTTATKDPSVEQIKALLRAATAREDMYTVAMCKLAVLHNNPAAVRYCAAQFPGYPGVEPAVGA